MKTKRTSPPRLIAPPLPALVLGALILLTGCVVTSVYPYYHAKDVTFDPALLGTWIEAKEDNAAKDTWTFEKLDDQTYKLTVADGDKKTEFDTRLFKLKGARFLDCLPRERPENSAPLHYLMRVDALTPTLELRLLDHDWLRKLLVQHPKAIRHTLVPRKAGDGDGGDLLLTADTDELQKFVARHLKTAEAWCEPAALKRQ